MCHPIYLQEENTTSFCGKLPKKDTYFFTQNLDLILFIISYIIHFQTETEEINPFHKHSIENTYLYQLILQIHGKMNFFPRGRNVAKMILYRMK